jgi:hypothetical protein
VRQMSDRATRILGPLKEINALVLGAIRKTVPDERGHLTVIDTYCVKDIDVSPEVVTMTEAGKRQLLLFMKQFGDGQFQISTDKISLTVTVNGSSVEIDGATCKPGITS